MTKDLFLCEIGNSLPLFLSSIPRCSKYLTSSEGTSAHADKINPIYPCSRLTFVNLKSISSVGMFVSDNTPFSVTIQPR